MRPYIGVMESGVVPFSSRTCSMRLEMSAQKLTAIVDGIAMTLVNAALVVALPMSAVLFVSQSF